MAVPPLEHMQAPEIGAAEAPPPLSSPWAPLVYAGADINIALNETANLSSEVIANLPQGLTINWSVASGPGAATFGDSSSTVTTAQFAEAGTYELELTVSNNGVAASDRVVVNVAAVDVVNIDQAWLDNSTNQATVNGDTVYVLKNVGKSYLLQTDVSTTGTAFYIANRDITLDLNGHTITYNTSNNSGPEVQGGHNLGTHGVVLYLDWHNSELTISGSGNPTGVVVKNGSIVNAHSGNLSHGIYGYRGYDSKLEKLEITTDGKDSHTIYLPSSSSNGPTITDCILTTRTSSTFNRHDGPANVHTGSGKVIAERNVLIGGNSGFNVGDNSVINENIIAHTGFATNGYGVFLYVASNVSITNNLILPVNGRGVLYNGGTGNTATGNVILHQEEQNEEFGEALNPPAIRSRYAASGNIYSDNVSLGIGGGDYTSASSIYLSDYNSENTFTNNVATTILVGTPSINRYAQPLTMEGQGGGSGNHAGPGVDVIANNTFNSNMYQVRVEGYDGIAQQSAPIQGNDFNWVDGTSAAQDFFAAVEAKLGNIALTSDTLAAAQTHINSLETLVEGVINGQGLQESRAFWQTKFASHSGTTTYADLIDSTWGEGVDPKSYTYQYSNLSAGAVKVREGFTQQVQFVNGATPLSNVSVTITSDQGDVSQAATDANGFATLTFYRFSIEKANAAASPFSVIDRTESTIAVDGKDITVVHSSVPNQIDVEAAPTAQQSSVQSSSIMPFQYDLGFPGASQSPTQPIESAVHGQQAVPIAASLADDQETEVTDEAEGSYATMANDLAINLLFNKKEKADDELISVLGSSDKEEEGLVEQFFEQLI